MAQLTKTALWMDKDGSRHYSSVHTRHRDGSITVSAPPEYSAPLLRVESYAVLDYDVDSRVKKNMGRLKKLLRHSTDEYISVDDLYAMGWEPGQVTWFRVAGDDLRYEQFYLRREDGKFSRYGEESKTEYVVVEWDTFGYVGICRK